jgi:hypothetical protein
MDQEGLVQLTSNNKMNFKDTVISNEQIMFITLKLRKC